MVMLEKLLYLRLKQKEKDLHISSRFIRTGTLKNCSLEGNDTPTMLVDVLESRNRMQFRCVVTDTAIVSTVSDTVTINVI